MPAFAVAQSSAEAANQCQEPLAQSPARAGAGGCRSGMDRTCSQRQGNARRAASLAGIPGILVGTLLIAPIASAPLVRMSFTLLLVSVAVTLFLLNRKERHVHSELPDVAGVRPALLAAGFVGGIFSGLVGNGIDIVDVTGDSQSNLIVEEDGGTTAADLGILGVGVV